jgi:hypothetical protein
MQGLQHHMWWFRGESMLVLWAKRQCLARHGSRVHSKPRITV